MLLRKHRHHPFPNSFLLAELKLNPLNNISPLPPLHPATILLLSVSVNIQSGQTLGPHVNGIIQYLPLVADFFHMAQCPQGSSMWLHGSEFLFFMRLNNIPFRCTIFMFSPNIWKAIMMLVCILSKATGPLKAYGEWSSVSACPELRECPGHRIFHFIYLFI